MTGNVRRTIDEILSRYELEPSLRDLYVEGVFDKDVITSALERNPEGWAIYEIETVDVPAEILIKNGQTLGNKQRVIALARELSKINQECAYFCLVDRDLDHWFNSLENTKRLLWSQFCSLELHYFSSEVISHILLTTCKARIIDFDVFLNSITKSLTLLYAFRISDRQLALSLRWIPFEDCLIRNGDSVLFSCEKYIDRVLQANKKFERKHDFVKAAQEFVSQASGDCRERIHGHDFVKIIVWAIKKFNGVKEFSSNQVIERLFVSMAPNITSIKEIIS